MAGDRIRRRMELSVGSRLEEGETVATTAQVLAGPSPGWLVFVGLPFAAPFYFLDELQGWDSFLLGSLLPATILGVGVGVGWLLFEKQRIVVLTSRRLLQFGSSMRSEARELISAHHPGELRVLGARRSSFGWSHVRLRYPNGAEERLNASAPFGNDLMEIVQALGGSPGRENEPGR